MVVCAPSWVTQCSTASRIDAEPVEAMLLTSTRNWTVAVAIEQFWDSDEAPWNYMMALAIMYALPPIAIFYALRGYLASGLAVGGVKR